MTGDRIRTLAVLVVATPCPLILALPVAIIAGMSRSAREGVLIKDGGALEMLSKVRTAILDKTGTLTFGEARIVAMKTALGWDADEMLRIAASLNQASGHVIAQALVKEANRRDRTLSPPTKASEIGGTGIRGQVEGRNVAAGSSRSSETLSQTAFHLRCAPTFPREAWLSRLRWMEHWRGSSSSPMTSGPTRLPCWTYSANPGLIGS